MARITWQNVTAPDLSTSRAALQQAGNSLSSGFQGFADSFRDIEQQQKDAYSQEALARLAQVSDPNQLNSMIANDGLAALGIEDPRYLNADAMQSILGRPKTLFDNQSTAANTANTDATRKQTLFDTFAAQQGLPTKLAQAAATLDSTKAGAALTKQQTKNAEQTFNTNEEKRQLRIDELKAQIAEITKRTEYDGNQDTRAKDKAQQEKDALELQLKQERNLGSFTAGLAEIPKTRESINQYFADATQKLKDDSTFYGAGVQDLLLKGADSYYAPFEQANLERRDSTIASQGAGIAERLTNENLGLSPNELIELAGRRYGTNQPLYQSIVENVNALNQDQFQINPDINDALRNNQAVRTSFTSINEALNANTGKFLNNPAWGAVELLESGTGVYRGKYEELLTAMRNAGSDEGARFWGVNNNDVLNTIENYVAETGENPDLVAAAVLSGQGTEARDWIQRAVPFVADATIDKKKIEKEVNKIKTAFNDPNIQRSVSAARAERDRLETKTRQIEDLLRRTGLAITRNPGISGSDYEKIIENLVEDIETIRGPISSPPPSSDLPVPTASQLQDLGSKGRNKARK